MTKKKLTADQKNILILKAKLEQLHHENEYAKEVNAHLNQKSEKVSLELEHQIKEKQEMSRIYAKQIVDLNEQISWFKNLVTMITVPSDSLAALDSNEESS